MAFDSDPQTIAVSSTQSLDRAMVLLSVVAKYPLAGVSLGQAAKQATLAKPTAHRLLTGLRNAGLVDYSVTERLFFPAYKLFQLGQVVGQRFGIVHQARPVLKKLAQITHDTVYLTLRRADCLLCVVREQGDFPIKTLTLAEGDERPLGLGSNGIAWLAAQEEVELERLFDVNRAALALYPEFSEEKLRRYVKQAQQDGYAFSHGFMMPEMSAMAMCVRDNDRRAIATVSVAAITSRFDGPRFSHVRQELERHVGMLEYLLHETESADQRSHVAVVG